MWVTKVISEASIIILSNLNVQEPQSSQGALTATRGNAVFLIYENTVVICKSGNLYYYYYYYYCCCYQIPISTAISTPQREVCQ